MDDSNINHRLLELLEDWKRGRLEYVKWIDFSLKRPAGDNIYGSSCTLCGEYGVSPTNSDYLSTIGASESDNIYMCSNCWATPGNVGFLPIPNGISADIRIAFFVPAMEIPSFRWDRSISAYR